MQGRVIRHHPESNRLARALARCQRYGAPWAGVVYRSASVRYANLIVFPGNLVPPESCLLIINRDQLPPRLQ